MGWARSKIDRKLPVGSLAQAGFVICIMVQRNRLWKSERQQVMAFLAMRGCKRRPQGNRPQKKVRQVIGRALRRSDEMASVAMRGCKRGQSPHQKFLDEIRQEREAKEAAKKKKEAAASRCQKFWEKKVLEKIRQKREANAAEKKKEAAARRWQKFLDKIRQQARDAEEGAKKKKEAAASIPSSAASSSKSWMPKPKPSPKAAMWPSFRGSVASCMQ
jgi:hypothetical protein